MRRAFGEDAVLRATREGPAVVPPKLDAAPSTLSAALRKPKHVRPGRWFTRGPAMLTLYFTQPAFEKVAAHRTVLQTFFNELGARRVLKKDVIVFNRARAGALTSVQPLARLVPSSTEKGAYELQQCAPTAAAVPCPPDSTEELTGSLLMSVVFTAADCVWAASHTSSRPRDIVFTLWNEYHVTSVPTRGFADDANALIYQQVVNGDLSGAHQWMRDALCDMVFSVSDAAAVDALLAEWNALVNLTTVACDASTSKLYTGKTPDVNPWITATGVFERETDARGSTTNALVHQPLAKVKKLDTNVLRARPLVRGLMLTTTQLALLFSVGTRAEFVALNSCLDATDPGALNLPILTRLMDNDRTEIRKRLTKLDTDVPEQMSLLSRASTVTLRA